MKGKQYILKKPLTIDSIYTLDQLHFKLSIGQLNITETYKLSDMFVELPSRVELQEQIEAILNYAIAGNSTEYKAKQIANLFLGEVIE